MVNGHGIVDSRLRESDDQAVMPIHLTGRFTIRMANGPATGRFDHEMIVPDVPDNPADRNFAEIIMRIIKCKSSRKN